MLKSSCFKNYSSKTTVQIQNQRIMRITIFFVALFFSSALLAQSWVSVAAIPNGRHHPVTFSLNGKGYSVTGTRSNNQPTDDFYVYDPALDTWSTLSDFPGAARSFAIGATYNGLAYMGFGASTTQYLNDIWSYDPNTNQWSQLASCPCSARRHPAFIAFNNKIYMGLGDNGNSDLKDWWVYDIALDAWTQIADLPGPARHHPFHFSAGGEVFAGMGHGGPVIYKDWYKLDTATNAWVATLQFPGEARVAGTQFSNDGVGYVLSGDGDNHNFMATGEFWSYNPNTDTWTQKTPHPGNSRWAPGSFVIDNVAYFFGGYNRANGQYPTDLWKYDLLGSIGIDEDASLTLNVYPNPASEYLTWKADERINQVMVLNSLGQEIIVSSRNAETIDVSTWQSGLYFIQFYANDELIRTEKIMVRH
jgi:N-acetylneuraminic acid mutarotase